MNAPDLQTIELNVLLLRKHAARIFLLWAGEWNSLVHPHVELAKSHRLAAAIQMLYWEIYNRNPTAHEWVYDFVMYANMNKTDEDIREQMTATEGAHYDTVLNKNKPFWALYQMAGYDLMRAAQSYSEEIGRVFLGLRPFDIGPMQITEMFKGLDMTKAQNIHKVVKNAGYKRPWWKRWLPTRKVKW